MDIMFDLNSEQKRAVTHGTGPLLIVAGAGTGKTMVITRRIAWLLLEKELPADSVLALTFTEKAAEEMETRVDQLLPLGYEDLWINTFHEFGKKVLEENALEIGLDPGFKVLTAADQYIFIRQHLFEFDLDYYRPLGNPTKFIQALLKLFSRAKDEEIDADEFSAYARRFKKEIARVPKGKTSTSSADERAAAAEEAAKIGELAGAYKKYQELMRAEGYMDFGDLIMYTLKLFRTRKSVLARYRKKFKYILVDEFQDTNFAQYQILRLLAAPANNLAVVGDDDQSVYRFRGAALNNILNFKKHYPRAREVVLKTNYRSTPGILDTAYQSIQGNNPDRLEIKLGIKKKLKIGREQKLPGNKKLLSKPRLIWAPTLENQVRRVVTQIVDIKKIEGRDWKDFAILVRANAQADPFVKVLERNHIPHQFVASKGLYTQPEVLDLLSYLKALDNFFDSTSLYRVTRIPVFQFDSQDIIRLLAFARRKSISFFEAMSASETISDLKPATKKSIKKLLELMHRHAQLAREKKVSEVLVKFLEDSGYMNILKKRDSLPEEQRFLNIVELFKRIQLFEQAGDTQLVKDFVAELEVATEGGEDPAPAEIQEGPDTVKIMTIHKAKGLEFPVVFLVSLIEGHFPGRDIKDPLPLPDGLLEETLPEASYIQEERRLFYVGLTRAQDQLYLAGAADYGGKRRRKLSRFVKEIEDMVEMFPGAAAEEEILQQKLFAKTLTTGDIKHKIPPKFSFTQIEAFQKCPLQYRFAHVLKIPTLGSHSFSYGKSLHNTLRDFFASQLKGQKLTAKDLLSLLAKNWQDDFYESKQHEKDRYRVAQKALRNFYKKVTATKPQALQIEKGFNMKLGKYVLRGAIDRIDKVSGGVEIIDYKTGDSKKGERDIKKPVQLLLYALAAEQVLRLSPQRLTLYYIDDNKSFSLEREKFAPQLSKIKEKTMETIEKIISSDFPATPSSFACHNCDFKMICPHRK